MQHGGGYQYRLTRRTATPVTETGFQQMPLAFTRRQGLRWPWGGGLAHGSVAIEIFFNATEVTEGVVPKGYAGRRNPIPILGGHAGLPGPVNVPSFPPPCANQSWCVGYQDGSCSGIHCAPEIVDSIQIPSEVPAGDYVLGWRWDCEQSNHIWQSCSDATIH